MTNNSLPLHGIRIIDLTSVIMGPLGTRILADLGADVIKVEGEEGDITRRHLPSRNENMSGAFLNLNRNKRSIKLDLKSENGRSHLVALIATADAFVHSLRPQSIEKLGFGYDAVKKIKADIVYCGAYGFGAGGPYAAKAAYDDLIQAASGMASLHTPTIGHPAYIPTALCDKLAGQVIAYSVLAALFQRFRDGRGQQLEIPMFETCVDFVMIEHMAGITFQPPLGEPGWARIFSKGRKPYQTKDGYVCILPYSDQNWIDYFNLIDQTILASDNRFKTISSRVKHIDFLYDLLEREAKTKSTDEWLLACDRLNIPCMKIINLTDLPNDPHLKAVGLFEAGLHPTEGHYQFTRSPVRFGGSSFEVRRHAPRLGEHTDEIISEMHKTSFLEQLPKEAAT